MAERFVEGVLVPFAGADKDKFGTYWDKDSDFVIDMFQPQPVFAYHGQDYARVGSLDKVEVRDDGLWVRARIQLTDKVKEIMDSGRAAWSSATMPHLMDVDKESGYVRRWPIVEASLILSEHAGARDGLTSAAYARMGEEEVPSVHAGAVRSEWLVFPTQAAGGVGTGEKLNGKGFPSERPAKEPAKEPAYMRGAPAVSLSAGAPPAPYEPNIRVASEWDGISTLGMAFAHQIGIRGAKGERFLRAIGERVADAYARHDGDFKRMAVDGSRGLVEKLDGREINYDVVGQWQKVMPYMRANELMGSTIAGFGDELVPTLLAQQAYHNVQLHSGILELFDNFDMPSQPYDYPVFTSGPEFHKTAEETDQNRMTVSNARTPTSRIGTGTVKFSAAKMTALTTEAEELYEDSTVDVAAGIASEYTRAMAYQIDEVLINGDTSAANTNISHAGAVPASTNRLLLLNGLRKLVGARAVDMAGYVADDNLVDVLKSMGRRGIFGRDLENLVLITSPEGSYELDKQLDDYMTLEKVGDLAVLIKGQLGFWRSIPVITTEAVPMAKADGTVSTTAAQNVKALMLVAHRKLVKVGWRRKPGVIAERVPGTDTRFVYASARLSMGQMEMNAVGMLRNISV